VGIDFQGLDSYAGSEIFHLEYPFRMPPYSATHLPSVEDLQFLPRSDLLVASYSTGQIAFWNVTNRQMVYSFQASYFSTTFEITPDAYFLLTRAGDGVIRIWGIAP
jgi:WD40 repeat protein